MMAKRRKRVVAPTATEVDAYVFIKENLNRLWLFVSAWVRRIVQL